MQLLVAFCFAAAVVNAATNSALACYEMALEESTFFEEEDLAAGVDGPAIAEVTIIRFSANTENRAVALARVNKVIKGPIDSAVIAIVADRSSCNRGFEVGATGIVVGQFRRDIQGMFEITAVSERLDDRQERRILRVGRQK